MAFKLACLVAVAIIVAVKAGPCVDGSGPAREDYCSDDQGWSCCISQTTFCVKKDPSVPSLPSRCCPHWTVGCTTGDVGCCDPAQPWQWNLKSTEKPAQASEDSMQVKNMPAQVSPAAAEEVAYALFLEDTVNPAKGGLKVMHINMTTGAIFDSVKVVGFENDFGESTREFVFDSARQKFYYLDANFTMNEGKRPAGGRQTLLYSVDVHSGTATKTLVKGANDFPTGYYMQESSGSIIMATEAWEGNQTAVTGFEFYTVDPTTATATHLATSHRAATENDPAFYAGFHRACDPAGKECYRLGFKDVTAQTGPGIGITTLSATDTASTVWSDAPQPPPKHDFYMSLHRYAGSVATGATEFLSLSPSTANAKRGLDLIQWSLPDSKSATSSGLTSNAGANATVLASFGDAHPPRGIGGGDLGYVADYVNKDRYVALVVDYGKTKKGDRWSIAVVDVAEKKSAVLPLLPRDLADSWAVEGLGVSMVGR